MTSAGDPMWDGFARAVVRLELPTGADVLEPRARGDVGSFPFDGPVHIVTAYNPAGLESDDDRNRARHAALGDELTGRKLVASAGSGPDGSMPEPGYAILDLPLAEAVELGRRFGQRAIYRWTADALTIVGTDEGVEIELGWALRGTG